MAIDHEPISVLEFEGDYARGDDQLVPLGYFSRSQNLDWDGDLLRTRRGSIEVYARPSNAAEIVRMFEYHRIGEASRIIFLDADGSFFDSTDLNTAILTINNAEDFSAVNLFNRLYISPHNRKEGMPGEKVYVYNGSSVRPAAGSKPTGTLVAATSNLSGDIDVGNYVIGVSYETESGFITKPGSLTVYEVDEDSKKKRIDISDIPLGPAGTVARYIVISKSIAVFDGNFAGYDMFFAPSGRIANNTSTTHELNFYETELVRDANFLFDQLEEIPAALGLADYDGKLITWNEDGNNNLVRVSKQSEPESFPSSDGFLIVAPQDSDGVKSCFIFRDSLYMCKSYRTYVTADNQQVAGTWVWIAIDKGGGTEVFGTAQILDSKGANIDHTFLASRDGLALFNGTFQDPELSWKVYNNWKRINKEQFDKVQVLVDPVQKKIYISVPLDGSDDISHLMVVDYRRGLYTSEGVGGPRWTIWKYPSGHSAITIIVGDEPVLYYANRQKIYSMNLSDTNDAGTVIPEPFFETGNLGIRDLLGTYHFDSIRFFVKGSGNLDVTLKRINNKVIRNKSHPLESNPETFKTQKVEYQGPGIKIRFGTSSVNEYFEITAMAIYAKLAYIS